MTTSTIAITLGPECCHKIWIKFAPDYLTAIETPAFLAAVRRTSSVLLPGGNFAPVSSIKYARHDGLACKNISLAPHCRGGGTLAKSSEFLIISPYYGLK
jgi:hypothetical protein